MNYDSIDEKEYEILEFLGRGKIAVIYKVRRKKDGEIMAIKTISLDMKMKMGIDEVKFMKMIENEYNIAKSLENCKNIVKYYRIYND